MIMNPLLEERKKKILDQLLFRIEAVQKAKNNKYILLNCPNEAIENITSVIPGMKSPTIIPLSKEGWSSLHSVVNENDFWNKIDQLKIKQQYKTCSDDPYNGFFQCIGKDCFL